jgi:hypothetical protein
VEPDPPGEPGQGSSIKVVIELGMGSPDCHRLHLAVAVGQAVEEVWVHLLEGERAKILSYVIRRGSERPWTHAPASDGAYLHEVLTADTVEDDHPEPAAEGTLHDEERAFHLKSDGKVRYIASCSDPSCRSALDRGQRRELTSLRFHSRLDVSKM